ncbi:Xaa-Pro dipeptidase [Spirochaetia bacterium]|nr:Xaa-Pro dipeptidase [Spirochaetia bacterium]
MKNSGMSPRYDRIKNELVKQGIDVAVAISPENVLYFAETYIQTQKSLRDRLAIAILPVDKEPVIIACVIEQHTVEDETWIKDKRYYFEFKESPIAFLVTALKERGLADKKIGIELDYLTAHYYRELMDALPNVQLFSSTDIFSVVRAIKTPDEIKKLQYAAIVTREAYEKSIQETHVGDLESDFAKRIAKKMIDSGCATIEFLVMGTGDRSILVHGLPADAPMLDFTHGRIDVGGLFDNYNSDIARTFTIGKPNPKHVDLFNRMLEAYRTAIGACVIGAPANAPFFAAKKKSEEIGIPFNRVHEGHGLGLSVHEYPMLAPGNTAPLEENMIMCVEHAMHVDGFRYHIEDLIQVTKSGPVVLSEPDNFNPHIQSIV